MFVEIATRAKDRKLIDEALENIRFHIKYSSLKLCRQSVRLTIRDNESIEIFHQRLEYSLSPFGKRILTFFCILNHILVTLTTIRFYIIGFLIFQYDYYESKIWLSDYSYLPLTKQPERCLNLTQAQKSALEHSTDFKSFIELDELLYRISIPTVPHTASIAYILVGSVSFSWFHLSSLLIKQLKPSLDLYDFISDLDYERVKFKLELNQLIDSLFFIEQSKNNNCYIYTSKHTIIPTNCLLLPPKEKSVELLNQLKNLHKFRLILNRKLGNLIKPAHLSDEWHQDVVKYTRLIKFFRFLPTFIPGMIYLITTLIVMIYNRVLYRLDLFECQSNDTDSTPDYLKVSRLPVHLAPLDDLNWVQLYKNHDGSIISTIQLFWIEFRLLKYICLYGLCEIVFIISVGMIYYPTYILIHFYEYKSKLCWLQQIEHQMDKCLFDLKRMSIIRSADSKMRDHQQATTMKSLTLAYLNFEMFRRRQKEYQKMTNFSVILVTSATVQSLIMCYLTCAYTKSSYTTIALLLATYLCGIWNLYLISGAIRASKVLRLMKNISRLLALSTENSLRQYLVVNLWATQFLGQSETKDFYSPNLFGIYVTYERIITLNFYLVGFWYIVLAG